MAENKHLNVKAHIHVLTSVLCVCRRRYERAEHEFVEAKIDLQKKSHLKEELTEHLYTIIHQNELRKAKKLTELMEKLNLENENEVLDFVS